jgi:hypothetical protein
VPLAPGGVSVNRYAPGFEKTFLDQNASIEVRLPFASTLNSDVVADGVTGMRTQLGNLNLALKLLLHGSQTWNLATGLSVALPTGNDSRIRLADGTDLVRIRNDAVILTPFLAVLVTPTDCLFAQTWLEFGFDPNGNAVAVNSDFNGLQGVGRIHDQVLAQLDVQVGYWLYRAEDNCRRLRGLAPFAEVHYNQTLGSADVIRTGVFQIGTPSHINELNVSLGLIAQIGDNINLSIGAVLPLLSRPDRTFDYQIGVRASIFFGPTARSRSAAAQVSSF